MKILKLKKGFSLTELLVSGFIFGFLALSTANILISIKKFSVDVEDEATKMADEEILNKVLYKLISQSNIGISYGILNTKDDHNKNFLDFYPDYHTDGLSEADKKRVFTLEHGKEILFLSGQNNFRRINVMELFDYWYDKLMDGGESPVDAFFNDCYLKEELRPLWNNKHLLLFYIPTYLRKLQGDTTEMSQFPKKPAFLSYMQGSKQTGSCSVLSSASTASSSVLKSSLLPTDYFNFLNPSPGANNSYTNIKDFILKSHLVAGQDVILVGNVRIVVFSIRDDILYQCIITKNGESVTGCGKEDKGTQVIKGIKSIQFTRESVSSTQIKLNFEFTPL